MSELWNGEIDIETDLEVLAKALEVSTGMPLITETEELLRERDERLLKWAIEEEKRSEEARETQEMEFNAHWTSGDRRFYYASVGALAFLYLCSVIAGQGIMTLVSFFGMATLLVNPVRFLSK